MNLSQTTKDVLEKIALAEKEGRFNEHLDDIVYPEYYKVDGDYRYDKPWYQKIAYFIIGIFIVYPYCFIVNNIWLKTKVTGKHNLKKVKGAVVTCNHVNKVDAIALGKALGRRKKHITVAEFNNMKCRLGTYMRVFGTMPFAESHEGIKNFNGHVDKYLSKGHFVTFFPERSEWWCYEKPRPLQPGAFHYAVKSNVPVLPVFITFKKTGKCDKQGIERRKFVVNILEPIFPKTGLSPKEQKEYFLQENQRLWEECYHSFYDNK